MLIRAATEHNFDSIATILNHVILHTAIHFAYEPVTATELREQWARHGSIYPFIVAEVERSVVGFAKAGAWRERAAYAWTPECSVYVQDDHQAARRRQGALRAALPDHERAGFPLGDRWHRVP
jgi:phosphinothricin acetyltransferase